MAKLTKKEQKKIAEAWKKFARKTIELDAEHSKKVGGHWLCGFYRLEEKFPQVNFTDPDTNKNIKTAVEGMGFNKYGEGDYFDDVIQDLLTEIGNPKTIEQINLSNLTFQNDIDFSQFRFITDVSFANTTFCGEVTFRLARFQTVNFSNAKFLKKTIFDIARFSEDSLFKEATFSNPVTFSNTGFEKDVDFSMTAFSANAKFKGTEFLGKANFEKTKFSKISDFSGAGFEYDVNFNKSVFSDNAYFIGTKFFETADFEDATFHNENSHCKETAKFRNTIFSKIANFRNTTFWGYANFKGAQLKGRAFFQEAKFKCHAPRFYDAKFNNEMTWAGIELPDFKEASVDRYEQVGEDFIPTEDQEIIEKNRIRRIEENQNSYENTAILLDGRNKYHDQHLFFRAEMRCRRELEKNYFNKRAYALYERLADYGYGIERAFGWWLGHIAVGILLIGLMVLGSFFFWGCWQDAELNLGQTLLCSVPISFANANPFAFIGSDKGSLVDCYDQMRKISPVIFGTIRVFQTIIGIIFIFLLLTTLRVRFRLK